MNRGSHKNVNLHFCGKKADKFSRIITQNNYKMKDSFIMNINFQKITLKAIEQNYPLFHY
jgi:hypothetical protein